MSKPDRQKDPKQPANRGAAPQPKHEPVTADMGPVDMAPGNSAESSSTSGQETRVLSSGSHPVFEIEFGPPAAPKEVGALGPYRIVRLLGRGGMGEVYLAVDTRLDRKLALKVMLPQFAADPVGRQRFLREAHAAAKVTNDNVITVYEADERDGVTYIAMQLLQGYSLAEYLRKKGRPSIPQIIRIARETASGLAAAHKTGLIHRDIKPANLWLEAPNGRVKVLDFGLAKPIDGDVDVSQSGAVLGTPAYMSPEQARGRKLDGRTDLFSLGGVLYFLCSGRYAFEGPTPVAMLTALAADEPRPVRELNPDVPLALAELIHQLLAKNPDQRPRTADELVQRLRAIAEDLARPSATMTITALPNTDLFADIDMTALTPVPPLPKQQSVPRLVWIAGAAAGAVLLFLFCLILFSRISGVPTKHPPVAPAVPPPPVAPPAITSPPAPPAKAATTPPTRP